jgi:hypothetical protein
VDGIDAAGGGEAVDEPAVRRDRQSGGFAWHSLRPDSRARTESPDTAHTVYSSRAACQLDVGVRLGARSR